MKIKVEKHLRTKANMSAISTLQKEDNLIKLLFKATKQAKMSSYLDA